eukprot:Gb_37125 [translate_table: standard]
MIFRATSSLISVFILDASADNPFISTLELRAFNGSTYATDYEEGFFLKFTARINFGTNSIEPIRYLDDPYDRIWESDAIERSNYLVGMALGTQDVSNTIRYEHPQVTAEQSDATEVVGTNGCLTYRLNVLHGADG